MTRMVGLAPSIAGSLGLLGLLGLVACGVMSSTLASSEAAADAGTAPPIGRGPDAASAAPDLEPQDNAVILVHAAKTQAFRLCFENEPLVRPQPDSAVMPDANVVGVDVGSVVRIGPRVAPGKVYLFDEPLIRAFYPQFGGAGAGPPCGELLTGALSSAAVELGVVVKDLQTGVHLLVVRGCSPKNPLVNYSTAECGADWTEAKGNLAVTEITLRGAVRPSSGTLPAQVVNLSPALEATRAGRDLLVDFGAFQGGELARVAENPALFGSATPSLPAELTYATDDPAVYATSGLRVSLAIPQGGASTIVLDDPLERVQALSAPRDVPTTYYATASNYAFLLLGDPNAKLSDGGAETDERKRLHFLAVPVIEPKADAGADDGGGNDGGDGGAAP